MKTIVWMRQDLRLQDNQALSAAAVNGSVLPVFIYPENLGAASYWWLHHSLLQLSRSFAEQGVSLILRTGSPAVVLAELCKESGCENVFWNRVYSPAGMSDGSDTRRALKQLGVTGKSFASQLLSEPHKVFNKQGKPYKVFTPFWRQCRIDLHPGTVLGVPKLYGFDSMPVGDKLSDWALLPERPDWSTGLQQRWQPGEAGAQQRWQEFLDNRVDEYQQGRDFPGQHVTSMLSPHLVFGEISPRQLWTDTHEAEVHGQINASNSSKFLAELGWREFSHYLLVHFPHILSEPFNQKFNDFPWQADKVLLKAWQQGRTGYPIVDAGMRELWETGYMHNRVRMITASFLTKHCLSHWRQGAQWFSDTLVDADIANNTVSWQWVAGCGADAAPYFRIFNPVLQGEKFDKYGDYVKRWVPELSALPDKYLHKPWQATEQILDKAGVRLGDNYPVPVVEHAEARGRALQAYHAVRTTQV